MTGAETALTIIAAVLATLVAVLVVELRRAHTEHSAALFVEHQMLLNAAVAQTPKDFGILKKLDREKPAPTSAPRMTEAEYQKMLRDDAAQMGMPDDWVEAIAGANIVIDKPDADLPVRPHGL